MLGSRQAMTLVVLASCLVGRASGLLLFQAPAAAARAAAGAWIRPSGAAAAAGRVARSMSAGSAQQWMQRQRQAGVAPLAAAASGGSNEYFAVIDE